MEEVNNKQKIEAIKTWMTKNNVKFKENHKTKVGLQIDLWLPALFIAIHISDENDVEFYKNTFKWCKPFFVRENETIEFLLEKIQNCCYDQMIYMQRKWQKENAK